MQKNKFVYEDIKAVCSSAVKKLVAMGLAVAVGVPSQGYGSSTHTVSAQVDHVIDDDGTTYVAGNGKTYVDGAGNTYVTGNSFTQVTGNSTTRVIGNGITYVDGNGQLTVPGNAAIVAVGANTINAGDRSTVYSISANLFSHAGTGAGIIDDGDIEFSGFTEDRPTRNVTVQDANSVTVAPGVPMRIQNGTEFTIGRTAQETLENLQRAIRLVPDNSQQMAPSNIFVRFFSGLMSVFTYILFGRWLGGSGGSN